LKTPDFAPAADLLQTAKSSLPVTGEYALVCAYAASQLIYTDRALAEGYLSRAAALPPEGLTAETRNWIARLQAVDYLQQKNYVTSYNFGLKAQKIVEDEKYDDQNMTKALLSAIEITWAQSLKDQHPAREYKLQEAYGRIKPMVLAGDSQAYQSFMDANHLLGRDAESKQVFSDLLDKNVDDHFAARGLLFVCAEYLFDLQCAYGAAKKALAKPGEDIGLQMDGVEAAVLVNDHKQAVEWLKANEQHGEADSMEKAVASFYRFWICYAEDCASSKRDFQHLIASLDEYNRVRGVSPDLAGGWSFAAAKRVLKEDKLAEAKNLPAAKKKLLMSIIAVFDNPSLGTAGLAQLAEGM
jgi:hypothetical protein